ncbi:uncharacterized protein LOC129580828 [Paramacrobiotus metropolitanus]|uniref:uncharacterized protein LOC129580828 n=1 Tax=Paramacrobiotus metropolitanus TaxID=2943436 RepID=UPI002445C2BB|nr:uncharacterized protein LOC129580828 [Paramacrobiotus metropolitanus]
MDESAAERNPSAASAGNSGGAESVSVAHSSSATTPPPQSDSATDPPPTMAAAIAVADAPSIVPDAAVSAATTADASTTAPTAASHSVAVNSAPEFKDTERAALPASSTTSPPLSSILTDTTTLQDRNVSAASPVAAVTSSAEENVASSPEESSRDVILPKVLPCPTTSSPATPASPSSLVDSSSTVFLRQPPAYSAIEHLRPARVSQRASSAFFRSQFRSGIAFRPLRFAPPMRAPPHRGGVPDTPRARDFRLVVPRSAATEFVKNHSVAADTLAKISELAEITRASIPMPPLEDDPDGHVAASSSRDNPRLGLPKASDASQPNTTNGRVLSQSPIPPMSTAPEERSIPMPITNQRDQQYSATASRAGAHLGIQVEVVHSISPAPPVSMGLLRSRFLAIKESNLGFANFAAAVAFLSLEETPLNPLEIESSKDILISIFGPKMTLYRCGGCDSTFIFRNIFADHFYRGIVPYRLRCQHCRDTLVFHNICQVKDHVKSHGFKIESCRGFMLTVGEYGDEQVKSDKDASNEPIVIVDDNNNDAKEPTVDAGRNNEALLPPRPAASATQLSRILTQSTDPLPRSRSPLDIFRDRYHKVADSEAQTSRNRVADEGGGNDVNAAMSAAAREARESHANVLHQVQLAKEKAAAAQQNQRNAVNLQSARANPPMGRHGPTITVGQVMEREFFAGQGSNVSAAARPLGACDCIFCNARFDSQSGLTHHFQRCKDVVRAGMEFRCQECQIVCCNPCSFQAHKLIHQIRKAGIFPSRMCCPECGLRIKHMDDIKSHVERRCVHWCRILCCSYSCVVPGCGYHVTSEEEMLRHVAITHGMSYGRGICPVCKVQAGVSPNDVFRHLRSVEVACRQRLLQRKSHFFAYRCNYCGEREAPVYETKAVMRDHIVGVHPEDANPTGLVSLLQSEPESAHRQASSSSVGADLRPVGKKIRIAGEEEEVISYQPPSSSTLRETSSVRCVFCGDKGIVVPNLKTVDDLEAHLYASHLSPTYPTTCFHCARPLNSSQEMLAHLLQQVLRLPLTRCDECDFVTLTAGGIIQHKIAYHQQRQVRPFLCDICRKVGFVNQMLLVDHKNKMHSQNGVSGFNHRADSDPSLYRSSSSMETTSRLMSSNARMLSSAKRAIDHDDLQQQRKLPARPPVLTCRFCNFQSNSESTLRQHMSRHEGSLNGSEREREPHLPRSPRYICKVCEAVQIRFTNDNADVFYDHIRREHPARDSAFQCSECALQLLSLPALQKHLRAVHEMSDPLGFLRQSSFYAASKMVQVGMMTASANSAAASMYQAAGTSMNNDNINHSNVRNTLKMRLNHSGNRDPSYGPSNAQ